MYRPVLGCRWPPIIMGPRKLGPTSSVGQCLARHVSQGAKESITRIGWCVLDSIVRAMRDRTSVTTHQLSVRKKPRSQGAHACGVDNTIRSDTSKEPLEEIRPARVTFQWWVACMAREQLGHSQDRWPQRLGAQVGTQVVIPSKVALQQGSLTR